MPGLSELTNQYTINGVLSTDDTVLRNMEKLCASAGCWMTYDIHDGLWSVIINQAGNSIASFNDSNITGPINIQSTGLNDLYNGVKVSYPRSDINDQIDFVQVDLPAVDRNYNEPDNVLEMTLDLCNDPVQAELIAAIELRQGRIDKVVTFVTDYSAIDINAGDIIDITSSVFGWTAKEFRVISMREVDDDAGAIRIEITALEYDDSIYDPNLTRLIRTNTNGIVTTGDIGTPAAPTITRFQTDARPRIVLEAVTPIGIVEGMEFWLSQTSNVAGFELLGTTFPVGGGSYGSTVTVDLDVDYLNSGNVWAKVRGINSATTGPFSAVQADTFSPKQTTQATTTATEVLDSGGTNILSTLSLSALLALLNGLLANNQTGSGSMFSQIFDLFASSTGSDIRTGQVPGVGVPVANAFGRITVAGQANVNAVGEDFFTLVAGNNVTITTNASTDQITINATGGNGSGNIGNLLVGPGGNTAIPLTANVQLVGNVLYTDNIYTDTQIKIYGNTAANPDTIRFAAFPGPGTMGYIRMGQQTVSGGPFPTGITSNTSTSNAISNSSVFVNVVYNWIDNGSGGNIDAFKRVQLDLNINGTSVANISDSSETQDPYENMVLNLYYASSITVGDDVSLTFTLDSDVATGCQMDYIILQAFPYAS